MRYVLLPNTLSEMNFRSSYEKAKTVDLDLPSAYFAMPTFFGGADVDLRKRQIDFLDKIRIVLKPNTFTIDEMPSCDEYFANLTASRVMIAAILYVQDQITKTYSLRGPKGNSVLYDLLDKDLGISPTNSLDEEDKACCYLAATRLTQCRGALEQVNTALRKVGLGAITEIEWKGFQDFLRAQDMSKLTGAVYADYPITNVSKRLFGAAGAYTGATIGLLSGEAISHTTHAVSAKMQFTALIGGTLILFSSAGPAGVALIAPAIAQRLINAFCSISLAHILGLSMGMLGQGVGIMVGIPLDISYKLVRKTCTAISSYAYPTEKALLTGTRLVDGMTLFCGIPIQLEAIDKLPVDVKAITMDVRAGELYINDIKVRADGPAVRLSEEALRRLKSKGMDYAIKGDKVQLTLIADEEGSPDPTMTPA